MPAALLATPFKAISTLALTFFAFLLFEAPMFTLLTALCFLASVTLVKLTIASGEDGRPTFSTALRRSCRSPAPTTRCVVRPITSARSYVPPNCAFLMPHRTSR